MIRILFLAANPIDQAHLRLRQEFDELCRALDAAEHCKQFVLISEFTVAAGHLQELLFRHKPQIVQFSGHGEEYFQLGVGNDQRPRRIPYYVENIA